VTSFRRHFVEANSRNLGGSHVCWGSYDGFNFAGGRGRCVRDRYISCRIANCQVLGCGSCYSRGYRRDASGRKPFGRSQHTHTNKPTPLGNTLAHRIVGYAIWPKFRGSSFLATSPLLLLRGSCEKFAPVESGLIAAVSAAHSC